MDARAFYGNVAKGSLLSKEAAADLTRAAIETLALRVSAGEVRDLAAQLPVPLAEAIGRHAKSPERFDLDELIKRVSKRTGLNTEETTAGVRRCSPHCANPSTRPRSPTSCRNCPPSSPGSWRHGTGENSRMDAWVVDHCAAVDDGPLRRVQRDVPEPGAAQVRVRVSCCGVCRTDLHLAECDLPPRRPAVVPGHEIVGRVEALGAGATRFAVGDRIGVPWLARTDGTCRFCRRGQENLCIAPSFTGWELTAGTPTHAWSTRPTRINCPTRSPTSRRLRCCAPASSATAPCSARPCRPADDWASTASVGAPI